METDHGTKGIVIGNEFASVELRVERCGNGMQAIVTDRRSGASRRIDVLALEGLVWAPEWVIVSLADPGLGESANGRRSSWREDDPGDGRPHEVAPSGAANGKR